MTGRINNLIDQSDFGSYAEIPDTYIVHKNDLVEFAELIVRECCQAVERRYKYSNGTPVSFWEMSQDVQDLLKEHFGVR